MEDLLRLYKKELLERIALKKTINKTNEQILLDNFKYFDLNGNNYCNKNDFIRVNERIGIKLRKKEDLIKIFNYFDKNNSNVINYRIFSKEILGLNNIEIDDNNFFVKKNNFINNNINNIINNDIDNNNNYEIKEKNKNIRRNGYIKRNMESYDNIAFNSEYDKYSNKNHNINNNSFNNNKNSINSKKNFYQEKNYINEEKESCSEYINKKINKINITEEPFFDKIISFLLHNNKYLPSKALLLFYKNFKIIQKKRSFNSISLEELIDILSKNKIDLYINNIYELFNYYKKDSNDNFYYEKFFEDIINIFWNEERFFLSEKKIKDILYKYRNKDKVIELNKIRIEDFFNLISITQNNNYNIISINNYFQNKLNIMNPDEYYNDIVNIFMEIKYLTTSNKDSTVTGKDILQLIKFISFGIKSNEDFYTAINYIFNTNKYAILNTKEKSQDKKKKNIYEKNVVKDKYNYNTSLSSLITIRKYMINKGIKVFINFIKSFNYYSNGRFIKKYDFAKVIKDFNLLINVNDIEQIFDNFSGDKNKLHLNYFKFIDILLDEFINKERIKLINNVYDSLENKLNNEINFENLKRQYNPKDNYYNYNENNFFENLKNFHTEFYLRKLPEEQRQYLTSRNNIFNNFRISKEEFLDFYKMISFIIEKDEIFENIIKTEWNIALSQDKEKNYFENNNDNNNNSINDDYDDYEDYNIKPKEITNYKKLKNDLLINYENNSNINDNNNYNTKNNNNKTFFNNEVMKIPIPNKIQRQNSDNNIRNINIDQKRIYRQNSPKRTFNNNTEINNNNNNNIFNTLSPLEKLTKKLKLRGLRGLMNLHKQFIFTCPNLSLISFPYFITVLKNQKINLEQNEYKELFNIFKNNNGNTLDFPKFIREFKKPLNDIRLSAVEDAFSLLDVDSNDNIFIETIKKKYNPKGNPLVKSGKKNEEEITTEFLDCFELNYNLLTAVENQNVTNVVSFEEFANFYEYVSFLYEDDDEFVQMVNESWNE